MDLLERASQLGRVVVSQDQDFLRIAHEWQAAGRPYRGLVFCRIADTTTGSLANDPALIAEAVGEEEIANSVVWVPL